MKVLLATIALVAVGFTSLALYEKPEKSKAQIIERGKYLVTVADCNGCHSPFIDTPKGPIVDSTRALSGYPGNIKLPEIPWNLIGPGKLGAVWTDIGTAFAGPWGISLPRNLTPDTATGLGSWTEAMFIKALRTGKDMGEGRDILPPMPWQNFAQMKDSDLKAIYAYLRTLKAVDNAVPDPISPSGERLPTAKGGKLPSK